MSSIRDMALYHAKNFDTIQEQINQAKMLLNFISESIKDSESSYAKLMMESVNMLKNKPDYYIAHDFLEINNKAFYLSDFVDQVKSKGLQYLSDADISNMYLPNYSDAIAEKIGEIDDLVRMEQYLDFTINRTFRCSLICHEDVAINREIGKGRMSGFYLKQFVESKKAEKEDDLSKSDIESTFYLGPNEANAVTTTDNTLKALLYSFQEKNSFISFDSLLEAVASKLVRQSSDEQNLMIEMTLLDLYMRGTLKLSADPITLSTSSLDKPEAWSYAVNQCTYSGESIVTNLYHQTVSLSLFETYMIRYIDGTRSKDEVIDKLLEHVKNGDLEANYGGKKLTSDEKIRNILSLAYLDG
ncbi:MAG: methyltransferase regulatory domain-containing protein, partial [Salibacteraceae bacterium]|nr:methyltransferase regulatory domain-containing protein [Salibacteraceae bacterium]